MLEGIECVLLIDELDSGVVIALFFVTVVIFGALVSSLFLTCV